MRAGRRVECEAQQHDTPHRTDRNMARMSNQDKAIAYAAERGITITTDHNDRGAIIRINLDGPYMKLRGYSCTATLGYSGNTVPQLWATIIRELETIPTEDTCHTCGTIVPTSYINRDGCDYCQCPTCVRCQLPEPRCECPDQDQDQDQDRDQDRDQDQDQDQDTDQDQDLWVCECCAFWLNGDRTSCRDYFNHTHRTAILRSTN